MIYKGYGVTHKSFILLSPKTNLTKRVAKAKRAVRTGLVKEDGDGEAMGSDLTM